MYAKTSDRTTYLKRVASHATKPLRTGRVVDIPCWAEKSEANSLLEEYQVLMQRSSTGSGTRAKWIGKIKAAKANGDLSNQRKYELLWFESRLLEMRIEDVARARRTQYPIKPKGGWPRKGVRLEKIVKGFR